VLSPHSISAFVFARERFAAVFILLALSLFLSGCVGVASRTPPAAPALTLSTTSFNFSNVVIGKTATQTLHINNTGSSALTIESLSLKSQQFFFTGPAVPRTILPRQSVSYAISFVPTTSGSLLASLQITTNASSAPVEVSLAGVGEKAFTAVQVSPSSIAFGNHSLQSSNTQTVTLKNTGDINLNISGVTVTGAGFGFSSLSPGVSVSPNQEVSFQVWFRPTVVGSASGTVSILSASLPSPTSISLSGGGVNSSSTSAETPHAVSLSWDASSSSTMGYRVYRSSVSGADFALLTATIPDLAYIDSTVAAGHTYYYVVTAVDSVGVESPFSNQVSAVIP
jgi:hypothetical protein